MKTLYASAQCYILCALLLVGARTGSAQPHYSFSQHTEPYTEITMGTLVGLAGGWAQVTALNGETFPVTGAPFTIGGARQLWVNEAGFFNIDYAPVNTVFISGLFHNFNGLVGIDATSMLTYEVTGTPGDRHLILQWKNYRRADGQAGDFVNFQIVMHQVSGVIEVRYGPSSNGGATYPASTGPNAGYYFANYDASSIYDRIWLTGDPDSPVLNTALAPSFTGLTTIPTTGTVYRFTPTWLLGIAESDTQAHLFNAALDPGTGTISVEFEDPGAGTLSLFDMQGRELAQVRRTTDRMRFATSGLPTAVYLVEYRSDDGQRQVLRVAMF